MNIVPPSSLEAEQAILGSILIDRDVLLKVEGILKTEDFYDQGNSFIYEVILELSKKGIPVDIVTLSNELRDRGLLDKAGGVDYIIQLASNVPTTSNVDYYANIIKDKSLKRKLIKVGNSILGFDYSGSSDVEELLDKAEQLIFDLAETNKPLNFYHIRELLPDCFERIESAYRKKSGITGIRTGFERLDELTAGFQQSDLIIIAARPSVGKTSFALNLATNIVLSENIPVAIFSLEMSKEQVVERIICANAEVDLKSLRTGIFLDETWEKISKSISVFYETPIYIDDTPDISVLEVRSKARRLLAEKGTFVLILDYLQLMHSEERIENRVQEISKITRQLKNLARELKIPVVVLSQLSRDIEKRQDKKPLLSDLRESGAIEQDADVVMFLHKPKDEEERDITELYLAKQRNGPTGKVDLIFEKKYTKFYERITH
jgi:replicative DNA helicase